MKHILPLLAIVLLGSCLQKNDPKTTAQGIVATDNVIGKTDSAVGEKKNENEKPPLTELEWKKQQDSLRNEILTKKENQVVQESFLQELYIRNVVTVSNDSLYFHIPFDLHGLDCGAPDCYSTDISFGFELGGIVRFPTTLQIDEHEHGCVEKEKRLNGHFRLLEKTDRYVIYHSKELKRTLVLFSSNKENNSTAYYFTGVGQNRINGKNLYSIEKEYEPEDRNSIYPFMSWMLTTKDYEHFQQVK